jgi:hypothetical protein
LWPNNRELYSVDKNKDNTSKVSTTRGPREQQWNEEERAEGSVYRKNMGIDAYNTRIEKASATNLD